jgi:quercetin dioxygenase-like cupin family protein
MSDRRVTHYRWDDVEHEELSERISRRLITGDQLMIAHVYLKQGAVVPEHAHHNEQLTYILEGLLRFTVDGETIDVAAGEVLTIPAHVPHMAEALEDTLDVDVFTPPREDWLDKSDSYLRG